MYLLKKLIIFFSFVFRHNDLPWNIRKFIHNKLNTVNFTSNLKTENPWGTSSWSHTDIGRLNQGLVGGQVSILVRFMGRVGPSGLNLGQVGPQDQKVGLGLFGFISKVKPGKLDRVFGHTLKQITQLNFYYLSILTENASALTELAHCIFNHFPLTLVKKWKRLFFPKPGILRLLLQKHNLIDIHIYISF